MPDRPASRDCDDLSVHSGGGDLPCRSARGGVSTVDVAGVLDQPGRQQSDHVVECVDTDEHDRVVHEEVYDRRQGRGDGDSGDRVALLADGVARDERSERDVAREK